MIKLFKKGLLVITIILTLVVLRVSATVVIYEELSVDLSKVENGIYQGIAPGRSGMIKLYVTINDNQISQVYIASHRDSTTQRLAVAEALDRLPKEMVSRNTVEVNTVSGATKTSKGLINAAKIALNSKPLSSEELIPEWKREKLYPNTLVDEILSDSRSTTISEIQNILNSTNKLKAYFDNEIDLGGQTANLTTNFAGEAFIKITNGSLTINAKNATFNVSGDASILSANTSENTFIAKDLEVGTLTVEGGSVLLKNTKITTKLAVTTSEENAPTNIIRVIGSSDIAEVDSTTNTLKQFEVTGTSKIAELKVTSTALEQVTISGSSALGSVKLDSAALKEVLISGASKVTTDLNIPVKSNVKVDVTTTNEVGKVTLSSGAGTFTPEVAVKDQNITVQNNSSSKAKVTASGDSQLTVSGSGASTVDVSELGENSGVIAEGSATITKPEGVEAITSLPENTKLITKFNGSNGYKFVHKGKFYDLPQGTTVMAQLTIDNSEANKGKIDYIVLGNVDLAAEADVTVAKGLYLIGDALIELNTYQLIANTDDIKIVSGLRFKDNEGQTIYQKELNQTVLTDALSTDEIVLLSDVLLDNTTALTIDKGLEINLNEFKLSNKNDSKKVTINVEMADLADRRIVKFYNGEIDFTKSINSDNPLTDYNFKVSGNSILGFSSVKAKTKGIFILNAGNPDGELDEPSTSEIVNSVIESTYRVITTNGAIVSEVVGAIDKTPVGKNVKILVAEAILKTNSGLSIEGESAPVVINTPGELILNTVELYTDKHGIVVRGGNANISNVTVKFDQTKVTDATVSSDFAAHEWGREDLAIPQAVLFAGNNNNDYYDYPTSVTIHEELKYEMQDGSAVPLGLAPIYAISAYKEGVEGGQTVNVAKNIVLLNQFLGGKIQAPVGTTSFIGQGTIIDGNFDIQGDLVTSIRNEGDLHNAINSPDPKYSKYIVTNLFTVTDNVPNIPQGMNLELARDVILMFERPVTNSGNVVVKGKIVLGEDATWTNNQGALFINEILDSGNIYGMVSQTPDTPRYQKYFIARSMTVTDLSEFPADVNLVINEDVVFTISGGTVTNNGNILSKGMIHLIDEATLVNGTNGKITKEIHDANNFLHATAENGPDIEYEKIIMLKNIWVGNDARSIKAGIELIIDDDVILTFDNTNITNKGTITSKGNIYLTNGATLTNAENGTMIKELHSNGDFYYMISDSNEVPKFQKYLITGVIEVTDAGEIPEHVKLTINENAGITFREVQVVNKGNITNKGVIYLTNGAKLTNAENGTMVKELHSNGDFYYMISESNEVPKFDEYIAMKDIEVTDADEIPEHVNLIINDDVTMTFRAVQITNKGSITNKGTIQFVDGATLENVENGESIKIVNEEGDIIGPDSNGYTKLVLAVDIHIGDTGFIINEGKVLEIPNGKTLSIPENSSFTNNGTILNNGTFHIKTGANLINNGTFTNNGTITNSGTITGDNSSIE